MNIALHLTSSGEYHRGSIPASMEGVHNKNSSPVHLYQMDRGKVEIFLQKEEVAPAVNRS